MAAAPQPPDTLLARLRADPVRAPETLALAAVEQHGPAAARWLAERRARAPHDQPGDLAKQAKRRHAALARYGGAVTGMGGLATVLPDLLALAWIQSRMVLFIAAAYGKDPVDPRRAAELLVVQEMYDEVEEAQAALDGAGRPLAVALAQKRLARDRDLVRRLARMAGTRAAERLAGRAIPGVASVVNAVGNEADTRALARRAMRFYARP
jgi:uncharacterized protein (DUF697 family)